MACFTGTPASLGVFSGICNQSFHCRQIFVDSGQSVQPMSALNGLPAKRDVGTIHGCRAIPPLPTMPSVLCDRSDGRLQGCPVARPLVNVIEHAAAQFRRKKLAQANLDSNVLLKTPQFRSGPRVGMFAACRQRLVGCLR